MTKRMSQKCYKVYERAMTTCKRGLPDYLQRMSRVLSDLDEILTEYEQNDLAFTREYSFLSKQWSDAEKSFYKMLKRWFYTRYLHDF